MMSNCNYDCSRRSGVEGKGLLKVVHVNVESLPVHWLEFQAIFENGCYDIIGASETFLKDGTCADFFQLKGFKMFRNDRAGKGGGGVCLYVRDGLSCKVIAKSDSHYTCKPEFLICEIRNVIWSVLVAVVYRPPKAGLRHSFFEVIEPMLPVWNDVVIIGDFNINMSGESSDKVFLQRFMSSNNLCCLPLENTYHRSYSSSWLDLIIVNTSNLVSDHGQTSVPGLSNHDLVFCTLQREVKRVPTIFKVRNFKKFDENGFKEAVNNIEWSSVYDAETTDFKVECLAVILQDLQDRFFPLKTVKSRGRSLAWLTSEIRTLMKIRDFSFKRYKKYPNSWTWDIYRNLRNQVKQKIRNGHCRDRESRYDSVSTQSEIWKLLRADGFGRKKKGSEGISVSLDGLNDYFCGMNGDCPDPALMLEYSSFFRDGISFEFDLVHSSEIENVIDKISSKATGGDGFCIALIKLIKSEVSTVLEHIFNFSLYFGEYPTQWKNAVITALPKVDSPSQFSHYRPINIISCLGKVFDKIAFRQLSQYIYRSNYLNPFQSGYRMGYSTQSALIRVCDDIKKAMDDRQVTVLVLLDFTRAFESVDHGLLLSILSSFNLCEGVVEWFRSYLSDRKQAVKGSAIMSQWKEIKRGVPQGSTLSSLLFSLFINSITKDLKYCRFMLYADDLQVYIHSDVGQIEYAIACLNSDIDVICNWCKRHGVRINVKKSFAIKFGTRKLLNKVTNAPKVMVEGVDILYSSTVRNLGVTMDECLTFSEYVGSVCQRANLVVYELRHATWKLSRRLRMRLIQSLMLPIFDYAACLFTGLTQQNVVRMQRAMNAGIRYVCDLKWDDHVSEHYRSLGWLKFKDRIDYAVASMSYRVVKKQTPMYIYRQFLENYRPPRLNVRNIYEYSIPVHRTAIYSKSFLITGIKLMREHKKLVEEAKSVRGFNKLLKENLLNKCFRGTGFA